MPATRAPHPRQPVPWLLGRPDFLASSLLVLAVVGCLAASSRAQVSAAAGGDVQKEAGLAAFSFGIKAGVGFAQHQGVEERNSEYTVSSEFRTGFAGGVFLYFPVTSRFGLQQEVMYTQKGSNQDIGVDILDIPTVLDVQYRMDYLEIPVLTRFTLVRATALDFYSLAGFAFGLKLNDHYTLAGEVSDGDQTIPITADADMSEVDIFDFSFVYGLGFEFPVGDRHLLLEYRFTLGLDRLPLPTYAYIPFEDEQILVDNEPVPLRNQHHAILAGIRF